MKTGPLTLGDHIKMDLALLGIGLLWALVLPVPMILLLPFRGWSRVTLPYRVYHAMVMAALGDGTYEAIRGVWKQFPEYVQPGL